MEARFSGLCFPMCLCVLFGYMWSAVFADKGDSLGWGESTTVIINDLAFEKSNALDFDSGRVYDLKSVKGASAAHYIGEIRDKGIDLTCYVSTPFLSCQDLDWIPVCNSQWTTARVDSLTHGKAWEMAISGQLPYSPQRASGGLRTMYLDIALPVTFLFRTAQGGVGLAQVQMTDADPNAMQIQYKMAVQRTPVRETPRFLDISRSRRSMYDFGVMCLEYALQHENMLPISIEQLDVESDEKQWAQENLIYLGNGKNLLETKDFSQVPLAYHRDLLDTYDLTLLLLANRNCVQVTRNQLEGILNRRQPIPIKLIPPEGKVTTAKNNKAQLPSGVTVELMQITHIQPSGKPVWAPNGRLMDDPLIDRVSNNPEQDSLWEWVNYFAFVARISGPAVDTIGNWTPWKSDYAFRNSTTSGYLNDWRIYYDHFLTSSAVFPKDIQSTCVRVAIAAGPWETINTGTGLGTYETDDSVVIIGPPNPPFDGPQSSDELQLGVSYEVGEKDFRVVAIDKDGKEHVAIKRRQKLYFEGLDYQNIKEFRFQVRPYLWVEFRDVALVPLSRY